MPTDEKALREKLDAMVNQECINKYETEAVYSVALDLLRRLEELEARLRLVSAEAERERMMHGHTAEQLAAREAELEEADKALIRQYHGIGYADMFDLDDEAVYEAALARENRRKASHD